MRILLYFWFATPVCPLSTYMYTPSESKRGFLHQIRAPFEAKYFAITANEKKGIVLTLYPSFSL